MIPLERGIELQLIGVIVLAAIGAWYWAMNQVIAWRTRTVPPVPAAKPPQQKSDAIAWAGRALTTPPRDLPTTLAYCRQRWGDVPLLFPIGWYRNHRGAPDCAAASFLDDTYHILISGQSRIGKDNLALQILLALALREPPERVQFCIIDGKGLDFIDLTDKAHTWWLADDVCDIRPTMEALTRERERRGRVLRYAQVSKWENYGGDLPLLVCYISELSLLEDATSKTDLTTWLNSELAAGAAFGIRYIVATQTASNFHTRWRSQISLYLAGFQPSQTQDQPNTGLTTKELRAEGGVPPSELRPYPDGAGVFTAVHGREAETVRAGYLSDEQRRALLACLPNREAIAPATYDPPLHDLLHHAPDRASAAWERGESPFATALPDANDAEADPAQSPDSGGGGQRSGSGVVVSSKEREAILAAREALSANGHPPSRRAVCRQVFNGATGGAAYRKVQAVLDAAEGGDSITTT